MFGIRTRLGTSALHTSGARIRNHNPFSKSTPLPEEAILFRPGWPAVSKEFGPGDRVSKVSHMKQYYAELTSALRDRIAVVEDQRLRQEDPAAQLQRLQEASERIDRLRTKLPADAHPMLAHYLERMSLTKALQFLEEHHLD